LISVVVLRVSVIFLRSAPADGAVRGAQEVEQALLVGLGERVVGRLLGHAGRLQLLEQRRRRAIELRGELGDGGHGHGAMFLGYFVRASGGGASWFRR
jgi:hypothetical protein